MQKYLVGGAVRDRLLSLPVQDRDWVVVGATPEEMLNQGYRQTGKDFPVFLHPDTHEEYALARTERKVVAGHRGFEIFSSPNITLEDDLLRRDLTINAIAEDEHGNILDPHNGQKDLQDRILRHVSPAFSEDPLRVLRVARFAARFWDLGFTIAPETLELMSSLSHTSELDSLSKERIWQETSRALETSRPEIFILILFQIGALSKLMPQLASALENKDTLLLLPHIKDLEHLEFKYTGLVMLGCNEGGLFNVGIAKQINKTMACPRAYHELSELTAAYIDQCSNALSLSSIQILSILQGLDNFRRQERALNTLHCIQSMHILFYNKPAPSIEFLISLSNNIVEISLNENDRQELTGKEIGDALNVQRCQYIDRAKANFK